MRHKLLLDYGGIEIMKEEKKKYGKSIAVFGLLFSLFFISVVIVGCSLTTNIHQLERDKDKEFDKGSGICISNISEKRSWTLPSSVRYGEL